MRFHVVLVLAFGKAMPPQGFLISCCFGTFVVPSSEFGLSGGLSAGGEHLRGPLIHGGGLAFMRFSCEFSHCE
jgi:hypothetical protein